MWSHFLSSKESADRERVIKTWLPFFPLVFTSLVSVFCRRKKKTLKLVRVVTLLCTVQTLRWVLLALGLTYSLQRFLHWRLQSLLNCPPRFVNAFHKLKPAPLSVLKQQVWRRWLLKNNLAYVINHPLAEHCVPRAKKTRFHPPGLSVFEEAKSWHCYCSRRCLFCFTVRTVRKLQIECSRGFFLVQQEKWFSERFFVYAAWVMLRPAM